MDTFSCKLSEEYRRKLGQIKRNSKDYLEYGKLWSDRRILEKFIRFAYVDSDNPRVQGNISGFHNLYTYWLNNIADNMGLIRDSKTVDDLRKDLLDGGTGRKANDPWLILGGGPSNKKDDYEMLRRVARSDFNGVIYCCDSILKDALRVGIVPDLVCSLDYKQICSYFYDDPLVKKHEDEMKMVCEISISKKTLESNNIEKYFFMAFLEENIGFNWNHYLGMMTGVPIMNGGGNVGLYGWVLGVYLGMNPVCFTGVDMAYPPDIKLEDTQKYYDYVISSGGKVTYKLNGDIDKHVLDRENIRFDELYVLDKFVRGEGEKNPQTPSVLLDAGFDCDMCRFDCKRRGDLDETFEHCRGLLAKLYFRKVYNPFFKNWCVTDVLFGSDMHGLRMCLKHLKKDLPELRTINCTGGGIVFGANIEQMHLKDFLERHKG